MAPTTQQKYLKIYYQYQPLWDKLSPDAREKARKRNYERLFDQAWRRVGQWENANRAGYPGQR
jgi:hypothetical protein